MELLIKEYFKFNGREKKDIKIIDELNPYKILRKYINKFIDKNLYKNKIENDINKINFKINYEIYDHVIDNEFAGNYINSEYLKDIVFKFTYKIMENNKFPIIAKFNPIIYNLYKENNKYTYNVNQDYGIFLYNTLIENKFLKVLEIGFGNGSAGLFITTALKNLELYDHKTFYTTIDLSKDIEKIDIEKNNYKNFEIIKTPVFIALPELLKNSIYDEKISKKYKVYDMIIINEKNEQNKIDHNLNFYYSDLLLNIGGYIILNFENIKEIEKYIKTNYSSYNKIVSNIGSWYIYQKLKETSL